jgi:hypothetical protein
MIVDVGETSSMSNVGEYAQPNDVEGLDDTKEGILLHGSDGRETVVTSAGEVLDEFQLNADVSKVEETEGEIFLLAENGYIYSRSSAGAVTPFIGDVYDFVVYGGYVYVSDYVVNTLGAYTTASRNPLSTAELENENALLGFSRLFNANRHLYAYDWAMGDLHAFDTRDNGGFDYLGRVDGLLCETYDIADFYSGLKTDRVQMQETADGFAMLCPHDEMGRASVLYYDLSDPESPEMVERLELPSGRYADIIIDGNAVYTVGFDNNAYLSTLSRFEGSSSVSHAFDGHANGVLLVDGEVWVADGDVGIRRFIETGDGFEFVDILDIEK